MLVPETSVALHVYYGRVFRGFPRTCPFPTWLSSCLVCFLVPDSVATETQMVTAHPTLPRDFQLLAEGGGAAGSASTYAARCTDVQHDGTDSSASSSPPSSPSQNSFSPLPFSLSNNLGSSSLFGNRDSAAALAEQQPLPSPQNERGGPSPPAARVDRPAHTLAATIVDRIQTMSRQQQPARRPQRLDHRGPGLRELEGVGGIGGGPAAAAAAAKTGDYMRGIARAIVGAASGAGGSGGGGSIDDWTRQDAVDPVAMLLPDFAVGDRVGGPAGRGPLLRRLQTSVHGKAIYCMLTCYVFGPMLCTNLLSVVMVGWGENFGRSDHILVWLIF